MNNINPTENSTVVAYYKTLEKMAGKENFSKFINGDYEFDADAPFLSVIMRTQGHRPEALSEVLLCLCGQSNMDFEVLVMGHNLDDDGRKSVLEIIDNLPDFMDNKVRLVEVTGGNRTTPLSRGFEAAKGRYISILDDDDLVFEDWVESFYALEKDNSGKILHTYCVLQDWLNKKNEAGETVLISASEFKTMYCVNFSLIKQLSQNFCPTFTLAFPAAAYKLLGIHFDETLTTTEDWDFLMRTALICGVADNPRITGIYRIWLNSENSATLHNKKEWKKNYRYIQNKFKSMPIIIPETENNSIFSETGGEVFSSDLNTEEFVLQFDEGSGFLPHRQLIPEFTGDNGKWHAKVTDFSKFDTIKAIRICPLRTGTVTISNFSLTVIDDKGNTVKTKVNKKRTNGVFFKNSVVFLGDLPQMRYDLSNPAKLSSVQFEFSILYNVPANFLKLPLLKYAIKHWSTAIFRRMRSFLKRFI